MVQPDNIQFVVRGFVHAGEQEIIFTAAAEIVEEYLSLFSFKWEKLPTEGRKTFHKRWLGGDLFTTCKGGY